MAILLMISVLFLPILVAVGWGFVLGRRYAQRDDETLSPVSRQHFELFRGAELNPRLVAATLSRFRTLLERGDEAAVEASLRPGEHFVVQVRALAELGTDAAGKILERQLDRHLSDDRLEQTWYRIDVASGLRALNREESLPRLLRASEFVDDAPLGPVYAAETLGFVAFPGYLKQPETPLGQAALRLLRRTLEGFRTCLPPQTAVETRLAELIETAWDARPWPPTPESVRVLAETQRYLRRLPAGLSLLQGEPSDEEAFRWHLSRLEALEPGLEDYLRRAGRAIADRLNTTPETSWREPLLALRDLRADAGPAILSRLDLLDGVTLEAALDALAWASGVEVGPRLCRLVRERVSLEARATARRSLWRSRKTIARDFPYAAALRALRRRRSAEAEAILLLAARDPSESHRLAALGSLGWSDPVDSAALVQCLEENRRHEQADVRRAARAAFARLGERSSLHWFRQAIFHQDATQAAEAIRYVATEGLTLLWPDLDRIADGDHLELAFHAQEAAILLSERVADDRR